MIRKERLDNGLTLLTESIPHVRSISIGVWLKQGSRHERPAVNGISHFLEHVVFKGTESRSARDIALAMDSIGGQLDAFTSKEYTCFYTKVLDQHSDAALDLLADIVQRPRFDEADLERERQVILEEIRMVEDSPDELAYDLFSESFYPGHPLGRPIQGTAESVSSLKRSGVKRFFEGAYRPERMIVAAAGNLKHARLRERVVEMFGSMRPSGKSAKPRRPPRSRAGITKRSKRLEQTHLVLGLPATPRSFEERYPLFTLNTLLGGTMSSRLFQRVREQRGLAYSVYSGVNAFSDSGFLMIYAATGPERAAETIRVVLDELRELRDRGPGDDEIAVAREHLKGSLMLSLESTSARMSNLARQEMYFGRQYGLKDIVRGIERVDRDVLVALSRRLFSGATVALTAVGRTGKLRLRESELVL